MKKLFVALFIAIFLCGAVFVLLRKYNYLQKTDSLVVKETKRIIPDDWGTVSSRFGFSLRYPSKEVSAILADDENFKAIFIFTPTLIRKDIGEEEIKKLDSDINNLDMYNGLVISVIDSGIDIPDLSIWAEEFLKKEDSKRNNKERVLSAENSAMVFSGQEGYVVTRLMEGSERQRSPHYIRREIFVRKDKTMCRISYLAPSDDTVFPRSGMAGKYFLDRVKTISESILETFIFDGSSVTNISVPKDSTPQPIGEANKNREELLVALRKSPFFDESAMHPEVRPDVKCSDVELQESRDKELRLPQNVYVSLGVVNDEKEAAEIHGYDNAGGHTGQAGVIHGSNNSLSEERARGLGWLNFGSYGYGLSIRENINGRIEIVGKKFSFIELRIRGNGDTCQIASVFIPVTPYSVATIPMNEEGDFGPISYDIDGDGTEDLLYSLIHPLLPQKEEELWAVISDMKENP